MTAIQIRAGLAGFIAALICGPSLAHVPYIEDSDFSSDMPFVVQNVPQSKAMYAWLEGPRDVDHYSIAVSEPTRIYMHMNIPYCAEYGEFTVTYALVGPGLPAPDATLPVSLPEGYGAIIVRDEFSSADDRSVMYEPFSARTYWEGAEYSITVDEPGEYSMIVWHESGAKGDYVAVIGDKEQFGPKDMWLAMTNTPGIRRGDELHVGCAKLQTASL